MDHQTHLSPPGSSEELERNFQVVNRALRVLSACTQAVIRATDETSLLQTLCHLITEEAAYRMAWIGYACHDAAKTVQPVAWAGYEADYLKTVNITWADTARGRGPTGRVIRSGRPVACQNMLADPNFSPWREAAQQRGYQSSLVLPLVNEGTVFGCLNIYSAEAEAFDAREIELLTELADSLSFGILALRAEQERKQAETILRQSEQRFAIAFAASPIPMLITQIETGLILDVNAQWEKQSGYSREASLGKTTLELKLFAHPEDRQRLLKQLLPSGSVHECELEMRVQTGELRQILLSSALLDMPRGSVLLTAIQDITERKRTEALIRELNQSLESRVLQRTAELTQATEQLKRLNQELNRSNQELEQFAYVASHDLQEPLRAITGYTQLLMSEYPDRFDETAQSYADFVVDGAKRMQQLIQDLLAYSRVGTRGKAFTATDCNRVVQEALRNLRVAIEESQARITVDPLPTLQADHNQLVQLLQNLIGNAMKFHREGPVSVHIQATQRQTDYLFQVEDNGIGIKPQYLDRIFEVFKRLHTRREYPGTGIGLAICKKIVLRHGGQIWAESQPGVGTTVYFTIPVNPYE